MKIQLVQMQPEVYNKEANLARILDYVDKGLAAGANLIAFGEMGLVGYDLQNAKFRELAEPIPGPSVNRIAEKLKDRHCYVVVGMPEADDGYIYNSVPLIGPEGVVGVCRKLYLANVESFLTGKICMEGVYFKPGQKVAVFDTEFGKIGIQICLDIYHPEVAITQALAGAWLILQPSAVSRLTTEGGKYPPVFASRPFETNTCWCYINIFGDQSGVQFHGGSMIHMGTQGLQKQASMGEQAREEVIEYEVDKETIFAQRQHYYYLKSIRPEILEQQLAAAKKVQWGESM